jgi:hypothetical protein
LLKVDTEPWISIHKSGNEKEARIESINSRHFPRIEIIEGTAKQFNVVYIPGLFSKTECELVGHVRAFPGAVEINDREESLNFRHRVWRVEKTWKRWKKIYQKALEAITEVDHLQWQQLTKASIPEVEYILYEVEEGAPLPSIEPHVDNASAITMVAMLSPREEYKGGLSCFEGDPSRTLSLKQGDAVFFRGEVCEHWITPVKEGRRSILQIEMSRVKKETPMAVTNSFDALSW